MGFKQHLPALCGRLFVFGLLVGVLGTVLPERGQASLDSYCGNDGRTTAYFEKRCETLFRPALEARVFPHLYSFEGGTLIFETTLPRRVVQKLYHAAHLVRAHFFRMTGMNKPVPGDRNTVLRIKIYGSKHDFDRYHTRLYGLPSNNGGIYIEQQSTLYTYERTRRESLYTLEELFRHEYAHYLIGRYLVPGLWAEAEIYKQDRMVWFDEGLAEFLVGSYTEASVSMRDILLRQIARDQQRMSVTAILSSHYGSFDFYRYAGLFFAYLYEEEPARLGRLIRTVHTGQATSMDQLTAELKADSVMANNFQTYLNDKLEPYQPTILSAK